MTCDAVGGVWQYATDLAGALAGEGVDVILAVLGPMAASHPVPAGIRVIATGLPLDWLADGPEAVLAAGRAIAALATELRADVVQVNSPALAATPFAVPVVAVAHGCVGTWFAGLGEDVPPALRWHAELVRAGLDAADAVVAPSASYAAAVARRYNLALPPAVVHNGRVAAVLPASDPADHVLTVGRLWDRAKNTALLDQVAAQLTVPLRAAGATKGPHGETAEADHLDLLGTLDAVALAQEHAARPIFVSAARFEPFGLAVLEAAQAGCPLVLSAIDTFRELWTGAALLVPEDDPAAYVAAIERLRGDAALRAHLGEAARQRAARYTLDVMAAEMLAIYRGLLAEPERRAA